MGNIKIELSIPGLRELRNEAGVKAELQKYGQQIADRANAMLEEGEGFVAENAEKGSTRAHVNVVCDSVHAYYSNLKNNTLLRAMK